MPDPQIAVNSDVLDNLTDPKVQAALEKSVKGQSQAPAISDLTGTYTDWKRLRDQLGQPFDATAVPLRKLTQMSRDPMISFALHYKTNPLARVQWHMEAKDANGPNPQVAAFMDAVWRRVHSDYVFSHLMDYRYGFSGMVKRFEQANPGGVYKDPTSGQEVPAWNEGNILPIILKPFVNLPPDMIQPLFDPNTGEFAGITLELTSATRNLSKGFKTSGGGGANQNTVNIDVWHSLWATNDRASVFGSMYGFPLIAHAYRYWWSYWWRWGQYDRAFERMAVPPIVAYHPEGDYIDPTDNTEVPYFEIALSAAERLRSNAVAAVPGTMATAGLDERGTNQRMWEFKFLEMTGNPFTHFEEAFAYLDIMKLRACWVPEQAFIEGGGGTSSRNVAAEMYEVHNASQANKWEEMAFYINNYILPQILVVNFPEFIANSGECRIVGHGFDSQDVDYWKQILQLVGQATPAALLDADARTMMERLNVPLLSPAEAANARAAAVASQTTPPPTNGGNNGLSVVPVSAQGIAGGTNGGSIPNIRPSATGFSDDVTMVYVAPNEIIEFSSDADFLAGLPGSKHYRDKTVLALAAQLRKAWVNHYRRLYRDFAKYVGDHDLATMEFEDDEDFADFEFAEGKVNINQARKIAKRLLDSFDTTERINSIADRSRNIIKRIVQRQLKLETSALGGKSKKPSEDDIDAWLDRQVGKLIKSTHDTTASEVRDHLVTSIRQGQTAKQISKSLRENFDGFEGFKSDRVARSEVRDAVNAGTLFAAEANEIDFARASDGRDFDDRCRERDGKLFRIKDAWREASPANTHPNDTLGFDLVPSQNFSIEPLDEESWPEERNRLLAFYDHDSLTVYYRKRLMGDDDAWENGIMPFASKIAQGLIFRKRMDDMKPEEVFA